MTTIPFTILEDGNAHSVAATSTDESADSVLRVESESTLSALGWTQKPEGLCQGDVCIPIAHRADLIKSEGTDLRALAEILGRPLAIDLSESVASMGAETASHGSQLSQGIAPDFTLPDLSGKEHSLSSFKGKKVLLIAYASW